MVMPAAMAELCPQCGADVRASGARCKSCGFWLPAAPAPRTGPPTARPEPLKDDSRRTLVAVLAVGGFVVLGLVAAGLMIVLREPDPNGAPPPAAAAMIAAAPSATPRIEASRLLANARREASAWHSDAVLVNLSAGPLDAEGVAPGGKVEVVYARPSGQPLTGGSEASAQRLVVSSTDGSLAKNEERAPKSRIAPEPNCSFEAAWASAQRAGADAGAGLRLRYGWNEKQARPIWEVVGNDGQVLRRLDGASCSILTR
jgi:hypothetical protein